MMLGAEDLRTELDNELPAHLNMTQDEAAASGASLGLILGAAIAHTETQLGFRLTDAAEFPNGVPDDLKIAILMLAASWFETRESILIGVSAQIVPHGYDAIIANHRSYTFG